MIAYGGGGDCLRRGMRELVGALEIVSVMIVVVGTQLHSFYKIPLNCTFKVCAFTM